MLRAIIKDIERVHEKPILVGHEQNLKVVLPHQVMDSPPNDSDIKF
jgi:hypothetical protein